MNIDDLTIGEAKALAAMFSQTSATNTADHDPVEVVVWTDKRGVIFGTTKNVHARPITLTNARMCLYWSKNVGGVFGLCENGPTNGCKISAALPEASFEGVTGVSKVTDKARIAWQKSPVQGREND